MDVLYFRFMRRMANSEKRFNEILTLKSSSTTADNWARIETLVNHSWQNWGLFCRQLIMTSALGGTTRGGVVIPACIAPPDWKRVSYIASCAFSRNPVKPIKTNSLMKKEPTWGNVDKLADIINELATANSSVLLPALSIASRSSSHMQVVRNCTAHMCGETFNLVKLIRPYYNVSTLRHPCDAAFWIDPNNGLFAFTSWLEDLRQSADKATT
jgi:hypothetical protein